LADLDGQIAGGIQESVPVIGMLCAPLSALLAAPGFLAVSLPIAAQVDQVAPSPAEMRQIARDACIYGLPMVEHYRIQYAYFLDPANPDYKAPYNQLLNIPRVYTTADTTVQTPQFRHALFIGGAGSAPGADRVHRALDRAAALLEHPADRSLHPQLRLSRQLHHRQRRRLLFDRSPAPAAVPALRLGQPLTPEELKTSLRFIAVMNDLLPYAHAHPADQKQRAAFALRPQQALPPVPRGSGGGHG